MPTNDNSFIEIFNQVKALCNKGEYKKAQTLLKKSIKLDKLERDYEIKEYYYYLGLTSLVGEGNYSDAHYNFNLALFSETGKKLDIIDVLTTNGIAVAYFLNDELDKAHVYFTKSIAQLEELRSAGDHLLDSMEVIKIYFNTAKYYSATENYKNAIEFCTIGIKLQQKEDKMHGLENLLYEKAHNLFKLENVTAKGKSKPVFSITSCMRLSLSRFWYYRIIRIIRIFNRSRIIFYTHIRRFI